MTLNTDRWYAHFLKWQKSSIPQRNLIIILSILVGMIGGLAAVILKTIINTVETSILGIFPAYLFLIIPIAGIFVVSAINHFIFKDLDSQKNISHIIHAIAKRSSVIAPVFTYSRMITAGLTQGLGGSAGLESPIVVTGSAIGSNIARFFKLEPKFRTLFIGCGAAAGIAAIFNAPITGVIFALEVIIPQFSSTYFIPVLISSASGSLLSGFLMPPESVLQVGSISAFGMKELPMIIILGALCGLCCVYFDYINRVIFKYLRVPNWWKRALSGSLGLGIILTLYPFFYGEGYFNLQYFLDGRVPELINETFFGRFHFHPLILIGFVFSLILLKPLATSLTVNSGGDGGMFAPSFITGGFLGYLFFYTVSQLYPGLGLNPTNYILFGMSGMLAGVMHAPLTAIFIIAELTTGYTLFVPLMLISAISYFVKLRWDATPVYFNQSGFKEFKQSYKEKAIMNDIDFGLLINRNNVELDENATLRESIHVMGTSRHNIFPVIKEENKLAGVILMDDIRPLLVDKGNYDEILVKDVMHVPSRWVELHDSIENIMKKFDTSESWYLPVVDDGEFVGFLSKSILLSAYRKAFRLSDEVF